VARCEGWMKPGAAWNMGRAVLGSRESSILELRGAMRSFRWTMNAMWAEVSQLNLIELVRTLQMPVFFLLGREDHFVPTHASRPTS
jgi:pimeloyl-ACP methyl ester carboxylesterase